MKIYEIVSEASTRSSMSDMARDLGGGTTPVMPSTIRHNGQTWERVHDGNYFNRATREVLPHSDLDARIKGAAPGAPAPGAPAPGGSRLDKAASVGRKALGPLAKAYLIYDGVKQIRALPADQLTRREMTAEVTKIVGGMVADAGVWWVGAGIGGVLGGTVGGPAGLVTAIAGGFLADAIIGDDVKSIVNWTVNFLMGTKDRPKPADPSNNTQVAPQTQPNANSSSNAPPAPNTPRPTQQASDPSLAPQTRSSQTSTPNNGGGSKASWSAIYDLNKDVIGGNPNLIKPGQVLQIPGKEPYTVKPGDTLSKIAAKA
jgi:LysM repeat protein